MELNEAIKLNNLLSIFKNEGIEALFKLPEKYGKASLSLPESTWDQLYDAVEAYLSNNLTGGTDIYDVNAFKEWKTNMIKFSEVFSCIK